MTPAWLEAPVTIIDGGLSTALELLGVRPSGLLWTAQFIVEQPQLIEDAHRSFVAAGADVVISSSYQASEPTLIADGLSATRARAALASTTDIARRSGARFVAASIGPFGAALGDGSEYTGVYDATWAEVREFHRHRIAVLVDTAPDLYAVETVPSRIEAEIVLEELELAGVGESMAWLSATCRDDRVTCAGDPIESIAKLADASRIVAAVGVNCTDPRFVGGLLARLSGETERPLVAYPNHGRTWIAGERTWMGEPKDLATHVRQWVAQGCRAVGGCCGVGPDELRRLASAAAIR